MSDRHIELKYLGEQPTYHGLITLPQDIFSYRESTLQNRDKLPEGRLSDFLNRAFHVYSLRSRNHTDFLVLPTAGVSAQPLNDLVNSLSGTMHGSDNRQPVAQLWNILKAKYQEVEDNENPDSLKEFLARFGISGFRNWDYFAQEAGVLADTLTLNTGSLGLNTPRFLYCENPQTAQEIIKNKSKLSFKRRLIHDDAFITRNTQPGTIIAQDETVTFEIIDIPPNDEIQYRVRYRDQGLYIVEGTLKPNTTLGLNIPAETTELVFEQDSKTFISSHLIYPILHWRRPDRDRSQAIWNIYANSPFKPIIDRYIHEQQRNIKTVGLSVYNASEFHLRMSFLTGMMIAALGSDVQGQWKQIQGPDDPTHSDTHHLKAARRQRKRLIDAIKPVPPYPQEGFPGYDPQKLPFAYIPEQAMDLPMLGDYQPGPEILPILILDSQAQIVSNNPILKKFENVTRRKN